MAQSVLTRGFCLLGEDPNHPRLAVVTSGGGPGILLQWTRWWTSICYSCWYCFANQLRMMTQQVLIIISYSSRICIKLWVLGWIYLFCRCPCTVWDPRVPWFTVAGPVKLSGWGRGEMVIVTSDEAVKNSLCTARHRSRNDVHLIITLEYF